MTCRIPFLAFLASLTLGAVGIVHAQEETSIKRGLTLEDYEYTLAEGVTSKSVTYYSDGVAAHAKIFYPKDFDSSKLTPAIVLGQGWGGTHFSIAKYGARFAERGLVAMAIDYRGWGLSNGYATIAERGEHTIDTDATHIDKRNEEVIVKRTRLIPMDQVEDYRNAISYIQGEPGVDKDRIGVWGSSYAGGHVVTVAGLDARVKVLVGQIPAIAGKGTEPAPFQMQDRLLGDAIKRAREGQGAITQTGFSTVRDIDMETYEKTSEYRPWHYLARVGDRPTLFIAAEHEELFNNEENSKAAMEVLTGPKKFIEVPDITHFEMYIDEAFEISSNAAADWFVEHLGTTK
ncbi:MAG: acetylxylan esterase [Cellvibrionaceae bacterium]